MHAPARSLIETRSRQKFPTLAPEEIERLGRFGESQACRAGDRLVEAGEVSPGCSCRTIRCMRRACGESLR